MFAAIRERLKGWKTIIWSRMLVVVGVVAGAIVPMLGVINGDMITALLPEKALPFAPLVLVVIGVVNETLRRFTTGPVGAKGDEEPALNVKAGD
jgi:hypothetical protein